MPISFPKSPKTTNIIIYSLGVFLGLIFVFAGAVSLTPLISADYHREVKISYNAFATKSLSFLNKFIDRVSLALYLRILFGSLQIVFGSLLIENGQKLGSLSKFGNIGLLVLNLVFLVLQYTAGTAFERIAPTIVFALLLGTRLLIIEQSSKRSRPGVKTRNAGKPKTSTPKKSKNE